MDTEKTSPSLIARLRDPADVEAWRLFDLRYRDLILRHCRRRGLQTADAEDIRQVVMLGLSRAMRSFRYDRAQGRFRDYLGRIVLNAIQRHFSRPSSGATGLSVEELDRLAVPSDASLDEEWELDWIRHHMRLAMKEVRSSFDPTSLAILERTLAGESAPDLAREFGKSTDAVHKSMQRIRDRLRELVTRQIREEEFPRSGGPAS